MKKEQIQDFTRRISQSNRTGLTLVTYDIFFAYTAEAKEAFDAGDWQRCKEALRGADRAVQELCDTLDFTYDLAKQLYQIYHFSKEAIAKSMYKKDLTELAQAERMMESLRRAFEKVASEDDSAPLMSNTEQVYAGFTYGKENLVENYQNPNGSRGFLA